MTTYNRKKFPVDKRFFLDYNKKCKWNKCSIKVRLMKGEIYKMGFLGSFLGLLGASAVFVGADVKERWDEIDRERAAHCGKSRTACGDEGKFKR